MEATERLKLDGPAVVRDTAARERYLVLLGSLFALFNSLRIVAYAPTIWAVAISMDSSQHSLCTWLTFLCANATMALWLWERNGRLFNRVIAVTVGNVVMCAVVVAVIGWSRW